MDRVCFLCKKVDGALSVFSDNNYEKCKKISRFRTHKKYKYSNINFEDSIPGNIGYHLQCYRDFTAVKSAQLKKFLEDEPQPSTSIINPPPSESESQQPVSSDIPSRITRSSSERISTTNSGVFEKVCIFCLKKEKRCAGGRQNLVAIQTKNFEERLRKQIADLEDHVFEARIAGINLIVKECHYHPICRLQYDNKHTAKTECESNVQKPVKSHVLFREAFRCLCEFVEEKIIINEEIFYFKNIVSEYKMLIFELFETEIENVNVGHLEAKILEVFNNRVEIKNEANLKNKIIFKTGLNLEIKLRENLANSSSSQQLRTSAFLIRKAVLNISAEKLPTSPSLGDLLKGECTTPPLLQEFCSLLIGGVQRKNRSNERKEMKIKSICQDIIYLVSDGRVRPEKQITLGLTMKSLTGSKRVLSILNKCGQTLSYHAVEELETEMTYSVQDRLTPLGFTPSPHLSTGLAFDNFDRFVDTVSGKDTLHDTVGILYQAEERSDEQNTSDHANPAKSKGVKRRRAFELECRELEPYSKKLKISECLLQLKTNEEPSSVIDYKMSDFIWMMCHAIKIPMTPMWVGFNYWFNDDRSAPVQKVFYLPSINVSPTSPSAIIETLNMSLEIAKSCHKTNMVVTYDLAIASKAMQIQFLEKPRFDTLFIQLGPFHICMAYFKAIGKFIDCCGISDAMVDADLLASGSVNGFIDGKHFNRCKRLHPIVSIAFQILHFESFLKSNNFSSTDLPQRELNRLISEETHCEVDLRNPVFQEIFEQYENYCKLTLSGAHGKTALFYFLYVNLVNNYQMFSRSIRVGDFKLYLFTLRQITELFFAVNQQNYSRWLSKYLDNIERARTTHYSNIEEDFRKGVFTVKRTEKNFSRAPVDLTLEQTINADAANKLTGISHFTNSISARQRWALSHSARTAVISHVLDQLGVLSKNDVAKEVTKHRIKTDTSSCQRFLQVLNNSMNPFDAEIQEDLLFNISTGKCATKSTEEFLLHVMQIGKTSFENFNAECFLDAERFQKPIRRNVIQTFATEGSKVLRTMKDGKIDVVKMQRDLLGQLLSISLEHDIDMSRVLKYPLTPVPFSLASIDGTIKKNHKSHLLQLLESKVESSPPIDVRATFVDGFFFIRLLGNSFSSVGKLAEALFNKLCLIKSNEIHCIFDIERTPSIKDCERDLRGARVDTTYYISGADQKITNLAAQLKNTSFKSSFVQFIPTFYGNEENGNLFTEYLNHKTIYFTSENSCYKFTAQDKKIVMEIVQEYYATHEEADTRLIYHLSKEVNGNVVIKTSDTDVVIILLANMDQLSDELHVWVDMGTSNYRRFIDITKLKDSLGLEICRALPGFHAFTGCDYTSAFHGKGKRIPFKIMEKSPKFLEAFASFGRSFNEETTRVMQTFVSQMYGVKKCDDVNLARLLIFNNVYKPKKNKQLFKKNIKGINATSFPPCLAELHQKILRTNFVCSIWNNATTQHPNLLEPLKNGWNLKDGKYEPVWFIGRMLPDDLDEIAVGSAKETNENCQSEAEENSDSDDAYSSSDEDDDVMLSDESD